nr:hypothetical protein [Tanacetum cinerariifolium]
MDYTKALLRPPPPYEDNICAYDCYVNIMCSSRPLGAYDLGIATPRALVYAGLMTSGDARSCSLRIVALRLIWTPAWAFGFVEVVQDEQVKMLSDKVASIDDDLIGIALHRDVEFYPCFLTTIVEKRWILGRGLRLVVMKCLQSLEYLADLGGAIGRANDKVASYNPAAEANYVSAVNTLCAMDFPAQVASHKDASMSDLMDLLRLEVVIGETSLSFYLDLIHARVQRIQGYAAARRLSLFDAMVLLIEPLSTKNLTGEASTSEIPAMATTTALSTTFIQTISVLQTSVADYEVLGAGLSTKVPSPQRLCLKRSRRLRRIIPQPLEFVAFFVVTPSWQCGRM